MSKEVKHEAEEAREADPPGGADSEDGLTRRAGRRRRGRRPARPRYRLKRSLELFSAADGTLYLIRSGIGEDYALEQPTLAQRVTLERLAAGPVAADEIADELIRNGFDAGGVDADVAALVDEGVAEVCPASSPLPPDEQDRYDRQLVYLADLAPPGTTADELQLRLTQSHVVLLGCGGLGTWTASALACAGVGKLTLIDDDRVELSNLNRQLLFGEPDLGRLKVEAAREALLEHNSGMNIEPVVCRIGGPGDLADPIKGAHLVIATADWPPFDLPRWVNEACLSAGVPYITAGQFLPWVRVGPLVVPGQTPCLECVERQTRERFPLFDELAHFRAQKPMIGATLGASAGFVGSVLATEAIHFLTAAAQPATIETALVFDLQRMTVAHERVTRQPACPQCY